MKKILVSVMIMAVAVSVFAESKYSSDVTAAGAAVTFRAKDAGWRLKAISAVNGANDKAVDVYARDTSNTLNPYSVSTVVGSTNVIFTNTGISVTNNDKVVYMHISGVPDYRTVVLATSTSAVLSSAISSAVAAGDKLYELSQQGAWNAGITNEAGKAVLAVDGDNFFKSPNDSPLYVIMAGTTNNVLTVTAE